MSLFKISLSKKKFSAPTIPLPISDFTHLHISQSIYILHYAGTHNVYTCNFTRCQPLYIVLSYKLLTLSSQYLARTIERKLSESLIKLSPSSDTDYRLSRAVDRSTVADIHIHVIHNSRLLPHCRVQISSKTRPRVKSREIESGKK